MGHAGKIFKKKLVKTKMLNGHNKQMLIAEQSIMNYLKAWMSDISIR